MNADLSTSSASDRGLSVAGVDIGGTQCSVNIGRLVDGTFRIVAREQFATRVDRGPERTISEIEHRLGMLWNGTAAPSCIGVSCGGPLDVERGVIQSPPNLPGWHDIAITARLETSLGVPCVIENDANASALAEWIFGAGRGASNLVYLTFGTGLGAGMILNGGSYRGLCGLAGEVGHWRLSPDHGPEKYGKRGSFESYCSGSGISAWYHYLARARPNDGALSAEAIAALARNGEPVAVQVFAQVADQLGAGVALLVDLLAPEIVIIGGIFVYANDLLAPGMARRLVREIHPSLASRTRVVPAGLADKVGSYASCCVALRNVLGTHGFGDPKGEMTLAVN